MPAEPVGQLGGGEGLGAAPDQAARPAKTAASAIRSMVESRNAPNAPAVPLILASVPSSMSVRTNPVQTMVPANKCPVGNSTSAPALMPIVPVMVSALGVIGVRASAVPIGLSSLAMAGRSTVSMAV